MASSRAPGGSDALLAEPMLARAVPTGMVPLVRLLPLAAMFISERHRRRRRPLLVAAVLLVLAGAAVAASWC